MSSPKFAEIEQIWWPKGKHYGGAIDGFMLKFKFGQKAFCDAAQKIKCCIIVFLDLFGSKFEIQKSILFTLITPKNESKKVAKIRADLTSKCREIPTLSDPDPGDSQEFPNIFRMCKL